MNKYFAAAHSIAIPGNAKLCLLGGGALFHIETPNGPLSVEAGRCDSVFVRGTPEAIIGFGLIDPDWLPGLPGNNATTQSVYFENDTPQLAYGKNRRGKRSSAPSLAIRAWGHQKRTVDVQFPISNDQQAAVTALWEYRDRRRQGNAQPSFAHRAEGNVVYLFGGMGT